MARGRRKAFNLWQGSGHGGARAHFHATNQELPYGVRIQFPTAIITSEIILV